MIYKKKLILAGFVFSALFCSQLISCSDDDEDEQDTPQFVDTMTVSGEIGGYSYVDLGLKSGIKWATYNVGSTKTTEIGAYFGWGKTDLNSSGSVGNYYASYFNTFGTTSFLYLTKYNVNKSLAYKNYLYSLVGDSMSVDSITVDSLTVLMAEDDAATVNWGDSWRMPTKEDQDELIEGCTWQWVENYGGSGVSGQMGTSKSNGNTIFLPAAGCYYYSSSSYHSPAIENKSMDLGEKGYYWSSSLNVDHPLEINACIFSDSSISTSYEDRDKDCGYFVRAVSE